MMKLIKVVWVDAALEAHNLSLEEAKGLQPMLRENIGYCISNDKDNLILTFGLIYDQDKKISVCDNTLIIPQGMVQKIEGLK